MSEFEYLPEGRDEALPVPEEPIATPAPSPDVDVGKGGSYMRDPVTGERVLIARTTGCCGE